MSDEKPVGSMSFEEAMKALEGVVSRLESGEAPLDESIKLYERGAELKAHCQQKLSEAEEKVAKITTDDSGAAKGTEPANIS